MKRCLPLLLSLFALAVPATAGATTFGAEVGSDFTNQVRGESSQTQVMTNLGSLYKAGGRVGRADSDWAGTEPKAPVRGRHTYDWGYNDLIVSEMASARLRWEPTLAFAPRWAEVHRSNVLHLTSGRVIAYLPPASNATFASYATAFMKRYGPRGAFWKANPKLPYVPVTTVEVWNEPDNIHDWGTDINLSDYARMYEAVRTAVHRVDRGARVERDAGPADHAAAESPRGCLGDGDRADRLIHDFTARGGDVELDVRARHVGRDVDAGRDDAGV